MNGAKRKTASRRSLRNSISVLISDGPRPRTSVLGTWAFSQTAAEQEGVIPGFLFPRVRRSFQRLVGDFVAEDLFFRPVASDGDGVAHSSDPSDGQLPIKGPCSFIIVIIEGAA